MLARRPRRRHHRRQALRPARPAPTSRAWSSTQEGLGQGGLQGPDDHRRARRADRADQDRRRRPRGAWASSPTPRPAGRPPTGSRTLVMQVRRRRRLQRLGHPQDPVRLRPWSSRRPTSSRSWCSPTATHSVAARRSPAPTSVTPGNPMWKAKPGCWMYKQGSFITGFFPEDIVEELRPRTSASSASRRPTAGGENPGPRWWRPGRAAQRQRRTPRTVMKLLAETDIGNDGRAERLVLHLAAQGLRLVALPERPVIKVADRWPTNGDRVPLRRVRPDAGRGRCGHLLEGDDRLDQRPARTSTPP